MNITDIDLKSLEVLDALVAEKNVTRAAERVGLSQPAVSHSLAKLRHFFGDPLLIRTRTGMIPTSRAVGLMEPIRQVMQMLRVAMEPEKDFQPEQATNFFRIAATDYAEWLVLPRLCKHVSEKAPRMRLEFDPLQERIPLRQLEKGEIDLAIGYFSGAPESLYQQELFSEDFVSVVGPNLSIKGKSLTLKKFISLKHLLVAPWGGMMSLMDSFLAKKGLKREVCISTTRFLVAPLIIAESDYIVTLPRRVAKRFSKWLPLTIIELPIELPTLSFRQIWHSRTHHEAAHKWLRSQIGNLKI